MWIRQESLSQRGAAGVLGRGVAERPGHEESDSGKVVRDLPEPAGGAFASVRAIRLPGSGARMTRPGVIAKAQRRARA